MSARHPASPCSLGQLLLSALVTGAIFLAALLGSSPGWHEALHPAESAAHVCLVTFTAAGQCEASVTPPVLTAPAFLASFNVLPPAGIFSHPPNHDFLAPRARAALGRLTNWIDRAPPRQCRSRVPRDTDPISRRT
ncbi:MAG TPA: hypothetical protein VGL24_05760 [Chthoniobacterales bacterium]